MTRTTRRGHYVEHNAVTRVPRAFIYLDTEAYEHDDGRSKVQTFRLAVAAIDRRYHHKDGWRDREWGTFRSTDDLLDWIDAACHAKARTILVCHNLAYDLRISDGIAGLTVRGWKLTGIRLESAQAWASWKRGTRTLVMVDSLSWVNVSLARVGEMLGLAKLDLPAWDDTDDAWVQRCTRDVEILAAMYRRLIDWVRAEDLGNWKATGAGQSWAAFRHRFMSHRVLVHEDADARLAEREAGWTGRCEAWRWGRQLGGPFTEWDYSAAYARIGAECKVPTRLLGEVSGGTLFRLDQGTGHNAVLCRVDVSTDVPTVPCRIGKRIAWPVGTFQTTLWDTEIALAREHGATVTPTRGWVYERTPALAEFCTWCLSILDAPEGEFDPIVRAAVKHWSRALIGRFGSRYSKWIEYGRVPWDDITLGYACDPDTDEVYQLMQLGGQLLRHTAEEDSASAVPSVMTWVMAECRARLWRSAVVAGLDHVRYLDTDSLIVDRHGNEALGLTALPGFRVKSRWQNVEILGPRQLILQGELRASGVPRDAHRVDATTWEGDVWNGLAQSIAHGESSSVRITPRRVRMVGNDPRRRHDPDGRTSPLVTV
jgi:hypothetical protein